jgi:hypothetical protein
MTLPTGPWQQVEIDFVGPLPTTERGNVYIFTIYDRYTRYCEAEATADCKSETAAAVFMRLVVFRWGFPEIVISDRGGHFLSELQTNLYKLMKIKRVKTTSYNPSANGGVERFNGTIKSLITLFTDDYQTDWDIVLYQVLFEYNTATPIEATASPYYINHGREPNNTLDILAYEKANEDNTDAYVQELSARIKSVHEQVSLILKAIHDSRVQESEKEHYQTYNVGDKVFLHTSVTPQGTSPKMRKVWQGPYTILSRQGPATYSIMMENNQDVVNARRLKPCHQDLASSEQHIEERKANNEAEINALQQRVSELQSQQQALTSTTASNIIVEIMHGYW